MKSDPKCSYFFEEEETSKDDGQLTSYHGKKILPGGQESHPRHCLSALETYMARGGDRAGTGQAGGEW